MSISNKTKRRLTCQFCDRKKDRCQCKKYYKDIYRKNREKILEIYHEEKNNKKKI